MTDNFGHCDDFSSLKQMPFQDVCISSRKDLAGLRLFSPRSRDCGGFITGVRRAENPMWGQIRRNGPCRDMRAVRFGWLADQQEYQDSSHQYLCFIIPYVQALGPFQTCVPLITGLEVSISAITPQQDFAALRAAAIDERTRNIYYGIGQLESLHSKIVAHAKDVIKSIPTFSHMQEHEAEIEFFLA